MNNSKAKRSYLQLPLLFSDNALFLHGVPFRVWGKTDKAVKSVSVFVKKGQKTVVSAKLSVKKGSFDGYLPPVSAGLGYALTFQAAGESKTVHNVAFGEVFLAGGQSNMGWRMFQCYNKDMSLLYQKEIDTSTNPAIRMFGVLRAYSDHKKREVTHSFSNGWQEANPSSVTDFGAIAYFFAQRMWQLCGIPVGVVMSCMGGTPIHTWLPKQNYENLLKEGFAPVSKDARPDCRPSCYFNGSIYPLRKYAFRGVLWYQGEGDYLRYAERYVELIRGWRALFKADLPFVDCGMHASEPEMEKYALCRIDHARVPSLISNAVYTAIGDTGLPLDKIGVTDNLNTNTGIHPYDKKTVGLRAAERFFGAFMGGTDLCASPYVERAECQTDGVLLTLANVGDGLALTNKAGFYAAFGTETPLLLTPSLVGNNQIFLPVQAKEGLTVEYGLRFADENGNKPQSMADTCGVYNTSGGELRYPLDSFRLTLQ